MHFLPKTTPWFAFFAVAASRLQNISFKKQWSDKAFVNLTVFRKDFVESF